MRPVLAPALASLAVLTGACRSTQSPATRVGERSGPESTVVAAHDPGDRPAGSPCLDDPGCADAGARARTHPPRPSLPELSFLFITVDTLRPDLGYAAYGRPVSPNIDELAKKATIYERAYSISTYTAYAVPPMMASRYPSEMPRSDRHEVRYFGTNVMLAERLRDAGYRTAAAASHFLFSSELGWIDGIDRFVMTGAEGNAPKGAHIDHRHTSRPLADTAIRFLEDPEFASGRFFLWVHFLDPHKKYLEHPGFSTFGTDPRALYDGEIAFTDHHIGRVLRALASSPAAQRTAIVFTGDHGEAFGEHGFSFHGREIWDEVVRIPLVVYVPGMEPHKISRRVSSVDIVPTILDLAGLAPDPDARGQSLAPEVFGGELAPRPVLVDQPRNPYYLPKRGFIDGSYKLHHLIDIDSYLLFDLDRDPGETNDLSGDPAVFAEVQRSYAAFTSKIVDFTPKRTIPYPSDKRSSRASAGLASGNHMP